MAPLTSTQIKKICKAKCEEHGVNVNFFYNKITPYSLKSEAEVISLLNELMFISFQTSYDDMYEGLVPSNECI